jgi:hypothetical protein
MALNTVATTKMTFRNMYVPVTTVPTIQNNTFSTIKSGATTLTPYGTNTTSNYYMTATNDLNNWTLTTTSTLYSDIRVMYALLTYNNVRNGYTRTLTDNVVVAGKSNPQPSTGSNPYDYDNACPYSWPDSIYPQYWISVFHNSNRTTSFTQNITFATPSVYTFSILVSCRYPPSATSVYNKEQKLDVSLSNGKYVTFTSTNGGNLIIEGSTALSSSRYIYFTTSTNSQNFALYKGTIPVPSIGTYTLSINITTGTLASGDSTMMFGNPMFSLS